MSPKNGWINDSGRYGEASLEKMGNHCIEAEKLGDRGAKKSYGGGFNTKAEPSFHKSQFHDGTVDSFKGMEIKGKKYELPKGE
jgi:hypothetical protein